MPEIHPLLAGLIAERKAKRITQTAIAKHIGISKTAVCELEQGLHEPRMRTFVGYAEALGHVVLPELCPEPLNDIEATGRCCCNGCIGEGKCDLDPSRWDEDDEINWREVDTDELDH
jgi:transcriptional regulator with XRE-family HTH domain